MLLKGFTGFFRLAASLVALIMIVGVFSKAAFAEQKLKLAPDFTLPSEGGGMSGDSITLSELKGQVVLINFWASWCGPCRKEMPLLENLYTQYKDRGVVILGINVELDPTKGLAFLEKVPVSFPILLDKDNTVTQMYGVDAMPTTLIIDRKGQIRTHHRGFKDGYEDLYEADLKMLLEEQ